MWTYVLLTVGYMIDEENYRYAQGPPNEAIGLIEPYSEDRFSLSVGIPFDTLLWTMDFHGYEYVNSMSLKLNDYLCIFRKKQNA